MIQHIKFLNPGNRPTGQAEFEQSQGNAAAARNTAPGVPGVVRPPKLIVGKIAPKAAAVSNAVRMLRVFFNLTALAPAVNILPQPADERSFLTIRNASTSAGPLLVGFGSPPQGVESCDYELIAGGYLLLDYRVPQDDVWLYSATGALGTVSYSINRRRRGR